ncbi:MAG: metal ABC transporter permease [Candidatus Caldarchaeum sp.]|nr:metal ABC transporter permease [Candidatus Caldarchaeum sp.]
MMEILQLPFMQRALVAGVLAGFLLPLVGNYIVPKKLSNLGDASSHVAFATIGLTALFGFVTDLVVYAVPAVAIYAVLVLINRLKIPGDQALAILLAVGASIASLSLSLGARVNLTAVLFGSVLFVTNEDIIAAAAVAAVTGVFVFVNFGKTILYTVNEELARVKGVKIGYYQFFFAIVAGLSIVSGIKVAGVLLVTALVAIPTAASSLISNSFKKAVIASIIFGISSTTLGIITSYYLGITPGAASVIFLIIILVVSALLWKLKVRI